MLAKLAVVALALLATVAAAQEETRRLIQLQPHVRVWMSEDEILNLIAKNVGFRDVTDHPDLGVSRKALNKNALAIPTTPTQQTQVNTYISSLDIRNVQNNLNVFTSFNNRYYTSSSGEQSSNWLFQTVQDYAGNRTDISVSQFTHLWLQKSVIAIIEGSSNREDVVVIGSHQDSINLRNPANGRAPGADDDGSGSMTILEIFRNLAQNGYKPELTVQFHWYSAEEVGLRGSAAVVSDFVDNDVDVRAMMQIDMDGYAINSEIAIITDYTDPAVNNFVKRLIDEYCDIPWVESECGYACSDHGSFTEAGYPSCFPFEQDFSNINPDIHTEDDTHIDFDHLAQWLKLGTAFAIELGTDN